MKLAQGAHQGVQPDWYEGSRLTYTVALGYVPLTMSSGVMAASSSLRAPPRPSTSVCHKKQLQAKAI